MGLHYFLVLRALSGFKYTKVGAVIAHVCLFSNIHNERKSMIWDSVSAIYLNFNNFG